MKLRMDLNKQDIRALTGYTYEKAVDIFHKAKNLDNDLFRWRPQRVPLHLVIEVLGWDKELTIKLLIENNK